MSQIIKTNQALEKLEKLAKMYSWGNIVSYHGDITYTFETREISFLEIAQLNAEGFSIGSFTSHSVGNTSYITVCIEYRGNLI